MSRNLIALALVGAVVGEVAPVEGDKSFTLEEIEVTAELRPNGVLLVRERVTYDFDGTPRTWMVGRTRRSGAAARRHVPLATTN